MRWECQERFPCHWLQRKPLISDPGMHHDTCVMHVPWCMSGSLNCGGGENVPNIPSACATHNFKYLARGPWCNCGLLVDHHFCSVWYSHAVCPLTPWDVHGNRILFILMKFSSLAVLEIVMLTTSSAASDLHWMLSFWQLPVQPVKILSKWWHFRFSIWGLFPAIGFIFLVSGWRNQFQCQFPQFGIKISCYLQCGLGPVSLTIFCPQFKFDGNFALL